MAEESTIVAIATPPGLGAIALIRMTGPRAREIAASVWSGANPAAWSPRHQNYGQIVDREGHAIDDVLLTWFASPASFTGEDVVEIACHGGVVVTRQIFDRLLSAGADSALPGEFSQRAFLNGKLDLTQAEAIMDLISAQTELAARAAHEQLTGRLGAQTETVRTDLVALLAHIEAYIDFPEEDIDPETGSDLSERLRQILSKLESLLATADQGRLLREGVRTVIAGAPNAGKSSLLNALLGFDRAIVNEAAGTTRDTIEEVINLRGIPLRLIDTAGLRKGETEIESEGISRTRSQLEQADLVIWMIDGSSPRPTHAEPEASYSQHRVRVINKSDQPEHPDWSGEDGLRISCLDQYSLEPLREEIWQRLTVGQSWESGSLVAINARHQSCLRKAHACLSEALQSLSEGVSPEFVAVDLRAGLHHVGEIVGHTDVEEILGEIFSSFCIGK
ncbi:MAG: tRNA uridine-5-carboxymethylaminomethyl(34) synthesis GTPase MnmE [Verrucomicrobiota bacterium]